MPGVAERLAAVRERIERAAVRSGRTAEQIRLVAVSKFQPATLIAEAVKAGQVEFGENRFQEVPGKQAELANYFGERADSLIWHFIGQLQTNKARKVVSHFDVIQSVDRLQLAQKLDTILAESGHTIDILLQVNVSGAEGQGGVTTDDAPELARACAEFRHLQVRGLMAIGPLTEEEKRLRPAFAEVRACAERINELHLPGVTMELLSMGMSGDYEIAIEEGANLVRIGTAIFGSRS